MVLTSHESFTCGLLILRKSSVPIAVLSSLQSLRRRPGKRLAGKRLEICACANIVVFCIVCRCVLSRVGANPSHLFFDAARTHTSLRASFTLRARPFEAILRKLLTSSVRSRLCAEIFLSGFILTPHAAASNGVVSCLRHSPAEESQGRRRAPGNRGQGQARTGGVEPQKEEEEEG